MYVLGLTGCSDTIAVVSSSHTTPPKTCSVITPVLSPSSWVFSPLLWGHSGTLRQYSSVHAISRLQKPFWVHGPGLLVIPSYQLCSNFSFNSTLDILSYHPSFEHPLWLSPLSQVAEWCLEVDADPCMLSQGDMSPCGCIWQVFRQGCHDGADPTSSSTPPHNSLRNYPGFVAQHGIF